jgi:hypothetical protein
MTPLAVTITRPHHPLEGQTRLVLGRLRRHGREELLLVLEDGSKSFIPSAWTDLAIHGDGVTTTSTLGSLADLLTASGLAHALSPRSVGQNLPRTCRG